MKITLARPASTPLRNGAVSLLIAPIPRADPPERLRDFYDIHAIASYGSRARLADYPHLIEMMFRIKDVPLGLIAHIEEQRNFHSIDWPSVVNSVTGEDLKDFDFYFNFVLEEVKPLEPLWIK